MQQNRPRLILVRCLRAIAGTLLVWATLAARTEAASSCVNPGGTGGCFASVQAAIDAAATGDLVTVAAGTYAEQITIGPPKRLTLVGAGAGATILQSAGGVPAVRVGPSTRTTLSGITLQDGGLAVDEAASVTLTGCAIDAGGGNAASAAARSRLSLEDCTISGASGPAIYSEGSQLDVVRSDIHDNTGTGIQTRKLRMTDSSVRDNGLYGIEMHGGRIRGSTVSGNLVYGVQVGSVAPFGGGTLRVERSTIHGNSFGGISVAERYAAIVDQSTVADNGEFGVAASAGFFRAPGRLTLRSSIVSGHATVVRGALTAGEQNGQGPFATKRSSSLRNGAAKVDCQQRRDDPFAAISCTVTGGTRAGSGGASCAPLPLTDTCARPSGPDSSLTCVMPSPTPTLALRRHAKPVVPIAVQHGREPQMPPPLTAAARSGCALPDASYTHSS